MSEPRTVFECDFGGASIASTGLAAVSFFTNDAADFALAMAAELDRLQTELAAIRTLCEKHNHPGCNTGAHGLAGQILQMLEE